MLTLNKTLALAVFTCVLMLPAAHAEDMKGMDHNMMKMDVAPTSPATPAGPGLYDKAMADMHAAMMGVKQTGDADVDFVTGMIPHHQGAIDMAKVQLANGKDPEIRKLCEGIIAAQEKEIAQMKEWLKKHGK